MSLSTLIEWVHRRELENQLVIAAITDAKSQIKKLTDENEAKQTRIVELLNQVDKFTLAEHRRKGTSKEKVK